MKDVFQNLSRKDKIYAVCCVVLAIAILVLLIDTLHVRKQQAQQEAQTQSQAVADLPEPITSEKVVIKEVEVEKLVEVEKEITSEIIAEGLNEMGILLTEKYFFTEVEKFSSVKTMLKIFPSKASAVFSYDGEITAGIDCTKITVSKNDDAKQIIISMPKAEIQNTDIDFNSFKCYEEKDGLWNKISLNDYNDSMIELEDKAQKRAIERGILEEADANAKLMISNFVNSLVDSKEYNITYVSK